MLLFIFYWNIRNNNLHPLWYLVLSLFRHQQYVNKLQLRSAFDQWSATKDHSHNPAATFTKCSPPSPNAEMTYWLHRRQWGLWRRHCRGVDWIISILCEVPVSSKLAMWYNSEVLFEVANEMFCRCRVWWYNDGIVAKYASFIYLKE